MRLALNNGTLLDLRYVRIDDQYHIRITGERQTNCGLEYPLFGRSLEKEPYNTCERCRITVKMIQSARPAD